MALKHGVDSLLFVTTLYAVSHAQYLLAYFYGCNNCCADLRMGHSCLQPFESSQYMSRLLEQIFGVLLSITY